MALSSYTELLDAVARWLHRTDLTDQIPDFITHTEAEMNRRLRVRKMVGRATASITIASEYVATPDDFLAERSVTLTEAAGVTMSPPVQLEITSQDHIEQLRGVSDTTGQPLYVAVVGTEFRYYPAPDQTYTAALTYFQSVPPLTTTNNSNWMLDAHPDAYLYGACAQAAPYMIEDGRIPVWEGKFTSIVGPPVSIQDAYREKGRRRLTVESGLLTRRSGFSITTGQ